MPQRKNSRIFGFIFHTPYSPLNPNDYNPKKRKKRRRRKKSGKLGNESTSSSSIRKNKKTPSSSNKPTPIRVTLNGVVIKSYVGKLAPRGTDKRTCAFYTNYENGATCRLFKICKINTCYYYRARRNKQTHSNQSQNYIQSTTQDLHQKTNSLLPKRNGASPENFYKTPPQRTNIAKDNSAKIAHPLVTYSKSHCSTKELAFIHNNMNMFHTIEFIDYLPKGLLHLPDQTSGLVCLRIQGFYVVKLSTSLWCVFKPSDHYYTFDRQFITIMQAFNYVSGIVRTQSKEGATK